MYIYISYQICDSASPSNLDLSKRSLAFSPDIVAEPSPTADLKSVSNFAWSAAVIKDSLMLGILVCDLDALRPLGLAVPPVWKDAATSANPVGCGLIGGGEMVELVG